MALVIDITGLLHCSFCITVSISYGDAIQISNADSIQVLDCRKVKKTEQICLPIVQISWAKMSMLNLEDPTSKLDKGKEHRRP